MKVVTQAPADEEPRDDGGPGQDGARPRVAPGTVRRIGPYVRPYRGALVVLLLVSALGAGITAATPLLIGLAIDRGIVPGRMHVVLTVAGAIIGLALLEAICQWVQARASGLVGEGVVFDLRTQLFKHVQGQPLAFFTRSQTGALVSRLNTDVIGAQQAVTTLLSESVNTVLTLVLVLIAMFFLSWQLTLVALITIPFFLLPGRVIGRRMQELARGTMQLNAELGSMMNERFNVSGAMLAKLYGRAEEEADVFGGRAENVREIGVRTMVTGQMLGIVMGLVASVTLGLMFAVGGALVVHGHFEIGKLVALVTLVTRMYNPVHQLSNLQASAMTALVSFDRVFEVLDLKPLVTDRPGAGPLVVRRAPGDEIGSGNGAPDIEFEHVRFRYPSASEVSLGSLESIAVPVRERPEHAWVLDDVSFRAPAGKLTAIVGPSGAGKTTLTHLVPRFYDPVEGAVRIGGSDLRDVATPSLRAGVGVVTQDAHLFHDTIRENLRYARPGASERELVEACRAAQIWDQVEKLPNGLDTVVGDRGYRLSGGEKQRIALARLLLKAPPVVVLDEATAHLDSESEAAIQRALRTALAGRTSLVIAHRLSTIRDADQILVLAGGRVVEQGPHDVLLAAGGLYATLYHTQFAPQRPAAAAEMAATAD